MSPLFKRVLRKEIGKKKLEPDVSFLNITALMDMMTIILVFLLKSLSQSTAQQPPNADLTMPKSVISAEPAEDGVTVLITKTHVIVDDQVVIDVPADATHRGSRWWTGRWSFRNHRVALPTPTADIVTDCLRVAPKSQSLSYGPSVAFSGK